MVRPIDDRQPPEFKKMINIHLQQDLNGQTYNSPYTASDSPRRAPWPYGMMGMSSLKELERTDNTAVWGIVTTAFLQVTAYTRYNACADER